MGLQRQEDTHQLCFHPTMLQTIQRTLELIQKNNRLKGELNLLLLIKQKAVHAEI